MDDGKRTPEEIPLKGFLEELAAIHSNIDDRALAFVLGAGASVSSGIPSGAKLVEEWLGRLRKRHAPDEKDIGAWATAGNLDIADFDYERAAEFYPAVFERCFRQDPDSGYANLENVMDGKEPGLGYAALARILADTDNRIVVTTNFDNLVADALAVYSRRQPLIVGHESLAGFVRGQLRRPLIAKIHRDLLMEPHNDPDGVGRLAKGWESALTRVFEYHTPVVIGYGGNDGSLMDFFADLDYGKIKGCFYWCLYRDEKPSPRIQQVMEKHGGYYTRIRSFEELMLALALKLLGKEFSVPRLAKDIEVRAKERADAFRRQSEQDQKSAQKEISKELVRNAFVPEVLDPDDWWSWQLAINAATSAKDQTELYKDAIAALPTNAELQGNFALFTENILKDYDDAERLYRRALALDPENAINTVNFADFMENVRNDYDEAERLYRRALELDPEDAYIAGTFALFMEDAREDYDEAEYLYRLALELDPEHANNTGNYALFMERSRKDYDAAERLYRRALEVAPEHANTTGNFATFMEEVRNDYDAAEHLYQRAYELDPSDAKITGHFAAFMTNVRKDYDAAEQLYRRTLELDPDSAHDASNFGTLLLVRDRLDESDRHLRIAWRLNKSKPNQLAGEILLGLLVLAFRNDSDPDPYLGMIKTLLDVESDRSPWSFVNLYEWANEHLDAVQVEKVRLLGEAILDEANIAQLHDAAWWESVDALPLDEPLPGAG